ncbi:MAG: phage major capsid protein [Candidatus Izemoplasmatales bacterium]|nr:phage major capsid protein [Candidatus Izemoplasmatales bacterium]
MNREQYLQARKEKYDKANTLLEEGKVDEANAIMDEIKNLDETFEKTAKAVANLSALSNNRAVHPIASAVVSPSTKSNETGNTEDGEDKAIVAKEKKYTVAWAKRLQNKKLTDEELNVFNEFNPKNELNTGNTQILIPKFVANGIWEKISEMYPFYNKVSKLNIKGTFELIKEDSSSEAEWYLEEDETEDGDEKFASYQLSGCELSRAIRVSWKLREMAIEDFIPYIQRKLAKKMGKALAHGSVNGKGKPGSDETFKPEPLGVITAIQKEKDTPRIITFSKTPTYESITSLLSKVKTGYKTELYATRETIFTKIANILDKTGKPYFVTDTTQGGVGIVLGHVVQEDDSIPADCVLCGDAEEYQMNFNKNITLDQEDLKKKRKTDYIAYAIADGAPITLDAFSLLKPETAAETTPTK